MLSSRNKGPAFRPQLRVCYLCGQQFGSASIGIHIPQCYSKKVAQWEVADPATRGKRPKHPDSVNWRGTGLSAEKLLDEQFQEFTNNLVPCERCGRKFLPDSLAVHLRGCKSGSRSPSAGAARNGIGSCKSVGSSGMQSGGGMSSPGGSQHEGRGKKNVCTGPGARPQLPICYLCGQQFGTRSIGIHVPQCYSKKLAQWEAADVLTRGKPPKHPESFNWRGPGGGNVEEHNEEQFAEFVRNLEPCPNCGRKFLADRLVVHLRSCKPGSSAKPLPAPGTSNSRPSTARAQQASATGLAGGGENHCERVPSRGAAWGGAKRSAELPSINPKLKRLPKDGTVAVGGRECPRCRVVEYDANAKYCRDCGANLNSKTLAKPCAQCREAIPEGSRFCGTCGFPIDGAPADERGEGAENINAPTVRVLTCPACRAVCDADGNFCDNCGGVLGDAEPVAVGGLPPSVVALKEVMYCKQCCETVDELSAKYCEECGTVLERKNVSDVGGGPPVAESTLSPRDIREASTSLRVSRKNTVATPLIERPPTTSGAKRDSAKVSAREGTQGGGVDVGRNSCGSPEANVKKASVNASPRSPQGGLRQSLDEGVYEVGEAEGRVECGKCGRKFAPVALQRHERVCASQKERKVFNMQAKRLAGTEAPSLSRRAEGGAGSPHVPKKDWRAESEAFRRSLREARQVDKVLKSGGNVRDLPPPTYSENNHYTPCPHCGRKFAPDVAERHIPRCATTINKPKAPPRRRF